MTDRHRVELRTTALDAGRVVVTAHGVVDRGTSAHLLDDLIKLLVDGVPVLLDVSDLTLKWAPAPEVFVVAVTSAGGWPHARLVLFGADAATTGRLRSCRVPEAVFLTGTMEQAAALVDVRPDRLSRGIDLPSRPDSIQRAREFLHDTGDRWGLPHRDDVASVVDELVTNAVVHASTGLRLRFVLERGGLRVSVRDWHPGRVTPGAGLRNVARLSRSWGVLHYADGKSVWANLPSVRTTKIEPVEAGTAPPESHPVAVRAPRRRRFATADPEQAHAFLRTVYGPFTLHLADAELNGFHLEYDGVATHRFAVERVRHATAVESLFAPADALVAVHPLAGSLRLTSRRDELRAGPGDVLLCDASTDVRITSPHLDVEVVRLDAVAVARVATELTGFAAPTLPIELCRAVSPARAANWRAMVAYLRRDVLAGDDVATGPLTRTALFRTLVAMLLETFPNPAISQIVSDGARARPHTLRRAIRYIEEHAGRDIGLADIAAAAGLGARGLQLAFRRHEDMTPLEYLRRVRLDRAHRDLLAATPAEITVSRIADRWGFPHHGNFSALYLRTYGCSPSATLRS
jgi:AraC-like DNA-binding protein